MVENVAMKELLALALPIHRRMHRRYVALESC